MLLQLRHVFLDRIAFVALQLSHPPSLTLLTIDAEAAIVGWVEVDGNQYEAFIFLVESEEYLNKNVIFKPLNQSTVNQLYNQTSWTH